MKITKFTHSCLLVEMPEPVNRTVLFDPGAMSQAALAVDKLEFLDDIVITHSHQDHFSLDLTKQLVAKFPKVRIVAPDDVVETLSEQGIDASSDPAEGMVAFTAPHENVEPLFPRPQQIGIHYLELLSHPGDSHSFNQTMPILALPVTGPWAATVTAINLAIKLKPQFVLPIHDWHWSPEGREQMYEIMKQAFQKEGISFIALKDGEPVVLDTSV